MERYEVLNSVGEGTYGLVLRCVHKCTGTHVAIKKFKESKDEERVRRTAARELDVVRSLHHTNLVSFLESFRANGKLHLVFEFMDRTLLHDMEQMPHGIPGETVESYMLQLVQAVQFLHQNKVMHRDLKPENMLLSEDGVLKLCDFGFARHLGGLNTKYSEYVATRWYRPPELLLGYTQYGLAVDVWALGCLLVEMATGEPLFPGTTDIDQLWLIMKATGHLTRQQMQVMQQNPHLASVRVPHQQMRDTLECRFPRLTHKQLQFVKACIQAEPARRPTCSQLLQSPYLQDAARNMPHSILAAQEASQQRVAAFKVAAHLPQPVRPHKGSRRVNLHASSRHVDIGLHTSSASGEHARSPHGRQAVPGPFLSPSAAPFYPRDPLLLQDQESDDVSMPDWTAQEVKGKPKRCAVGKGREAHKQHVGFRLGSLQSDGSGLIGTGHMSAGGSGGAPRNSKRSLLPDLMLEGEESHESWLDVPSSPPKKFKLDSSRPEDTSIPSAASGLQLPCQPGMSHDTGHVMMSQPGQKALLGAESLVSRAPVGAEGNDPNDYTKGRHVSYDAAAAGVSHAEVEAQHAKQDSWCASSAPQGTSGQRAGRVQGQLAACAPHVGQVPALAPPGEQLWDRLDVQTGQQAFQTTGHQSLEMQPQHASHAHQEDCFQAEAMVHEGNQHHHQMYPVALKAKNAAWPVRTPQQQQQQQQQIQFPSAADFNPADFYSSAVSPPGAGMQRGVRGAQEVWDSLSSAESYSTESEASECEEQVMYEGHLGEPRESDSGDAGWPKQDVPQVQRMSRGI